MKFIIRKSDFLEGINTVIKAVPTNTTYDYLKYLKITVNDGTVKLSASDMDLFIETVIECKTEVDGEICVDANFINKVLKTLPDNDLIIEESEGQRVEIKYDNNKNASSFLNYFKTDKFPEFPKYEKENPIVISQATLKNLINTTIFSISNNENNKIMTGELFEIKDGVLKVVSLDGHRISLRREHLKEKYDDIKVIIPGKTLSEISKIITGESDKNVDIYLNKDNVIFEFDNNTVISRLIAGEYFNIDHLISNEYTIKVKINKKDLINGINRADPFIIEGEKKAVVFEFNDEYLKISVNSSDGANNDYIDIEKEGSDIRIGFNAKYILDAARVVEEDEINIYMINPKTPCFIKDEEDKYFYLILPVNI